MVILNEWVEKKLGEIAEVRMCKRIFAQQTTSSGEIPFYKIGTFGKEPDAYISASLYAEYKNKYSFPKKGDVLLSAAGTLGRTVVYDGKPAYFQDSNIVWLEIDYNFICNEYLNHCYQVIEWASPEGSTISRLYNGIIRNTSIKLPPLPEQTAIAEALADADSLLASLEKLIAKKKAIKQGAMQELLTGKKRLPGFSGGGKELNLVTNSKLKARIGWQGLTTAEYLSQGEYILITGTDFVNGKIEWSTCCYVEKKRYDQDPHIQITEGDVLITKDGTIGKVAFVKQLPKPATLNSGVFVVRPLARSSYNSRFVYHILNSSIFVDFLSKLSAGSTINHLYQKDIGGFSFLAPPTTGEQKAIASILSDMDTEIEQLEKKLAKYRLIKQGMMQELLTGRIRLIETDKKSESAPKGHNQHYDDAIAISAIVNAFYDDRFILGRVKVQKLLYLLRRKQDADMSAFKKKAAGPYNEEARYNGGESIAAKSGYIVVERNNNGSKFSKGSSIAAALKYVGSMQSDIDWLLEKFRFYNTNKETKNLEVLATVDMAVCELEKNGKTVNLDAVKDVIRSNKEWALKLQKSYFTDAAINQAILESKELFS